MFTLKHEACVWVRVCVTRVCRSEDNLGWNQLSLSSFMGIWSSRCDKWFLLADPLGCLRRPSLKCPFIIQLCFSDFLSEHFLYSFFHLLITEWVYLNQFTYFTVYSNWKEDIIENFKLIVNLLRTYIHESNWGKAVLKIRSASYISYITSQRSSFALYSSHDVQAV